MPEGSNICILPVQSPVPYTILQKICQQRKWIFCQNVECGGEVAIVRGQAISFFSGDPGLYKLCPISEVGIIHCTDHTFRVRSNNPDQTHFNMMQDMSSQKKKECGNGKDRCEA